MFELVAPSGHELATRADIEMILEAIEAMDRRWQQRFDAMHACIEWGEGQWRELFRVSEERSQQRHEETEARWGAQFEFVEHRLTATFERGLRDAITTQTCTLVFSQLGAVVVIAGLAFGLSG